MHSTIDIALISAYFCCIKVKQSGRGYQLKLTSLKTLMPEELKAILSNKSISTRDIADALKINHSAVVCTINGNYKGAEDTKDRIYEQISKMLEGREDISDTIYDNADTMIRVILAGINSPKTAIPEKEFLISLHKKLNTYKEAQHA